ncbi:hypothetical protein OQA88_9417 [Cercophora sp. LCS_1]
MPSSQPKGRQILPKPRGLGEDAPKLPPASGQLIKKSAKVGVACEQCRAKRTKCNGQKPSCSRCASIGRACTYRVVGDVELKRKHQDLETTATSMQDVLELLRNAPEDTAARVFQELRNGTSLSEILDTIGPKATSPLSHLQASRNASAPTDSTLEFCLNANHSTAFPRLTPLHLANFDLKLLGLGASNDILGRPSKKPRSERTAFDPKPEAASPGYPYIDSRLEDLDIHRWTDVPISNSLASRVISFYLANEHPILGPFSPGLFVRDLVSGDQRFCSPLLVSALLAWSCGPYAQFEPELKSLS